MDQPGGTQAQAILNHLKAGHALTPLEALDRFGCFRLGARIWDLKKTPEGQHIQSEMFELPSGKRVARYWLELPKGQLEMFKARTENSWHASAP